MYVICMLFSGFAELGWSLFSDLWFSVLCIFGEAVLGNFVSALNRFIADRYAANHSVSEYHVYEFFKVLPAASSHHVSNVPYLWR